VKGQLEREVHKTTLLLTIILSCSYEINNYNLIHEERKCIFEGVRISLSKELHSEDVRVSLSKEFFLTMGRIIVDYT